MAYQVGATCYATAQQAAQVAASSVGGTIVKQGDQAFTISIGQVTGTSIAYVYTNFDKSVSYTSVQPYSAQPCASENNIKDQTDLFYLMLMVVIGVWGGRQLYNFFNRGPND